MATKLYVGNLPYTTTEDQLRELFEGKGEVDSVSLITDKYTGQSKGFAFIEMRSDEDAKKAISDLNQQDFSGRALNVSEAKPREDRPGGGRPGGGGGGRPGGGGGRRY